MNTETNMMKRQRPNHDADVKAAMSALCEAMHEWWELENGDHLELFAPDAGRDRSREAEMPNSEVLAEVVALFVARWRDCRLLTEDPYRVVAFDDRVKEALSGKLANHPTMSF